VGTLRPTVLIALLLGLSGCAEPSAVRIATDAVFPPFHFVDDSGSVTGHDVELAVLATARTGRRSEVVRVESYRALFEGLESGRHDVIAATTGITEERRARYGFTRPYFVTCLAIVVRAGPGEPTTRIALAGRRVAASAGTTSVGAAGSIDGATVVETPSGADALAALRAGEVDAFVADEFEAVELARDDAALRVLEVPAARESYGFILRRDDEALRRALDDALAALEADGTSARLRARFGLERPPDWPVRVTATEEPAWVTYEGDDGPGAGRRIVLISGDEEYRSEEALPQLGRILAARHGFTCTVLFAIDPQTGMIDPDHRRNIPGLEMLRAADLVIIATRFRDLPDEQMSHLATYLARGGPIIGLRTATHAFAMESSPTFRRYSWNSAEPGFEQGFGRQILGETWIAHHGRHGSQSTRGVIAPGAHDHPIARGIARDGQPVVLGQVLDGMTPDSLPAAGEQNDPMMPVAWTRTYPAGDGRRGRVFTTTMGAATDLLAPGTRRMIVNAVYWILGLESALPRDGAAVDLVGDYAPSPFGFGGFRRGVRPADHAPAGRVKGAP
jgi:ABC-type amino acid transport substrate-binding protein